MTTIDVPSSERGVIRVFRVALDDAAAKAFANDPDAIAAALGVDEIDAQHAEVFPLTNLAGLGLSQYLREGYGIPEERLAPEATDLDTLEGWVAVVATPAFRGQPVTLDIAPPLVFIGEYAEDIAPPRFEALPEGGAEGIVAGGTVPVDPGPRSRGPLVVLLLAVAILGLLAIIRFGGGG